MLAVVIVLGLTTLAALGALVWVLVRPQPQPRPDPRLGAALDGTLARSVSPTGTRRVISVEILNVGELAGTRGRLAGIAGTVLPGLTARFVYDQTIKTMRRQLAAERVVADIRMHTLARVEPARPAGRETPKGPGARVRVDDPTGDTVDTVERTDAAGLADVDADGSARSTARGDDNRG